MRSRVHLAWLLSGVGLSSVAAAAIAPSNSSTTGPQAQNVFNLSAGQTQIASVVPLTREAGQSSIEGNLYNTNSTSYASLSHTDIAYISCNPADYQGGTDADAVFKAAYENANITGVLLYSTVTDLCTFQQSGGQDIMQSFPVLSMINKQASASILNQIKNQPQDTKYVVKVTVRGDNGGNSSSGIQQQQNPLGPSPSTAVAMIILYSITGIITALCLVIIITGAIRAHRHPERYGPRNVVGRPRQSRARGLGRAILDTIPIVKFGEKEPAKPTDVELAQTADAANANATTDTTSQMTGANAETTAAAAAAAAASVREPQAATPSDDVQASTQNEEGGIAPAQAATAATWTGKETSTNDENLGCSICTEDFEKGQDLRVLPCDHKFHPECVDPWLLNVSGTCPLCRVDLNPPTSDDPSASQDQDQPDASTSPEADLSHRRRTAFREFLSLRTRPNATPEERIHALRRLREQRRNRADEPTAAATNEGPNVSAEDISITRRTSKRMSVRLSDVFSGRARRDRSPLEQQGESSRAATRQQSSTPSPAPPTREGSPGRAV